MTTKWVNVRETVTVGVGTVRAVVVASAFAEFVDVLELLVGDVVLFDRPAFVAFLGS